MSQGNGDRSAVAAYHVYQPRTLWFLIAIAVLTLGLLAFGHGTETLAGMLFIGEIIAVMALDGRNVFRLRGRLERVPGAALAAIVFFLWPFWLWAYLIVAVLDRDQAPPALPGRLSPKELARQQRIARLEGELGMLPVSLGACPSCHQPLQAGAEFCAYCGAAVTPALRVCPTCGARTFPDAKWCPECGSSLTAEGAPAP